MCACCSARKQDCLIENYVRLCATINNIIYFNHRRESMFNWTHHMRHDSDATLYARSASRVRGKRKSIIECSIE